MRERVMYNTYYESFESFKSAIFLTTISDPESVFGQDFSRRIRDKFRPINAPSMS
jgi:hypothetical protein